MPFYEVRPSGLFIILERKFMKKKKRNNWPLIVTILAFTISLLFSFMSESVMPKVGIMVGIMILLLFNAL